jgi:hypothetical protein
MGNLAYDSIDCNAGESKVVREENFKGKAGHFYGIARNIS